MRPTEGYCAHCHYMIPLTEEGRLTCHGSRTAYLNGGAAGRTPDCAGVAAFPVPPPSDGDDPAVAFSSAERVARCPVCKSRDAVAHETSGRVYMMWHKAPVISQEGPEGAVCPGTWDPIEYALETEL